MKIGREVEGRLKGIKTLFLDAEHIEKARTFLDQGDNAVLQHLYISDQSNTLDYHTVSDIFPEHLVTMDITEVLYDSPIDLPENVVLMLRVKGGTQEIFENVERMRTTDMIKIEHQRKVYCFTVGNAVVTFPREFEQDIEINVQE